MTLLKAREKGGVSSFLYERQLATSDSDDRDIQVRPTIKLHVIYLFIHLFIISLPISMYRPTYVYRSMFTYLSYLLLHAWRAWTQNIHAVGTFPLDIRKRKLLA